MKLLKRIIRNFNLSEKFLIKNFPSYNSFHWEKFNKNKKINEYNIKNFRKNGLSFGLDDQDITTFEFFNKIINYVGENFLFKNLLKKNIGNSSKVYKFGRYFIDYNQLVFIYWFKKIKNYINHNKIKVVCEIGGGFGQFSELILNNKKNVKLIYIDLPLSCFLASYYLKKNFPKKKFYFFDNYLKKNSLSENDLQKYDIFILPPNCEIEKKLKIDFFINMRSMMEMKISSINSYFDFIHQHASKNSYFFNLNRFHKKIGNEIISLERFNYDKNWDVLSSGKSFNQEWIYYILTKRKFKNFKNRITNEKEIIKKLGKKYKITKNIFLVSLKFIFTQLTSFFINLIIFVFGKKIVQRIIYRLSTYQ